MFDNFNLKRVKLSHIIYKLSSIKHPDYMEMTVIDVQ